MSMSGSKGTRPFQPTAVEAQLIREGKEAVAALRHAALLAAGVHGGPGAWRWASDPTGTTLADEAAWERLLGEMRGPGSLEVLRWGVVANTINSASRAPRWVHVKRITGFGSTAAQKLCRDAGFDPGEEVGSRPEPCAEEEEDEEAEDE